MTLKASRLLASRNLTYVNQSGANKIADVIGLVGRIDNGETITKNIAREWNSSRLDDEARLKINDFTNEHKVVTYQWAYGSIQ